MWCTHNQNMNQPMKIYGRKLTYLGKQVLWTDPFLQLVPTKSKPNVDITILNELNLFSPISFIISYKTHAKFL